MLRNFHTKHQVLSPFGDHKQQYMNEFNHNDPSQTGQPPTGGPTSNHHDDDTFGYTLKQTHQGKSVNRQEEEHGFTFSTLKLVIGIAGLLVFFNGNVDWAFLLYIAIVILCHEVGHVIAGKLCGCHIKEMQVFLVAFISYKPKSRAGDKSWRQIRWSLGAVPLGGLTVFKTRQADAAADSRKYGPSVNRWRDAATSPYLDDKPAWQRLFISAAGVMVNIIMFGLFYFVLPSFLPLHMHRMSDSIAFLSLVLALLNILPIYPLDGGAILFALYEIITGRKPSPTFTKYCGMIGFAFIILFFWVFPHWMNGFLDKILEIFF